MALLDLYLSKIPSDALQKDNFYLRPLQKKPDNPGAAWFSSMQVGINTMNDMLKKMCDQAVIECRSNHSLRTTGASEMFQANLPEHVIQSRTGHLSLKALRTYERVTEEQHKEACKILTAIDSPQESTKSINPSTSTVAKPQAVSPLMANTLFGNPQNCTINVQIYSNPSFQQCPFQGMKIVQQEAESSDDILVDSIF